MKKLIIAFVCALSALTVAAQRASSSHSSFFSTSKAETGVQFGIRAGLNSSTMKETWGKNDSYTTDAHTAWHVGVIADIPLMESLYIQTGLYYQNKGGVDEEEGGYSKYTYNPSYLEIPVLASYRYDFSDALQLQINVGPYFAYGIGGKAKYEVNVEPYKGDSEETDFFGDDDDKYGAKRFDCGLQFGAGLTIASHYYIGFAYQLGLTNNMYNDDGGDDTLKNRNWMFSLGYNF